MTYFLLKQDERITDRPYPRDFFQKIDVRHVTAQTADKVPMRTLIHLRSYAHTVFPDVLCTPALLLTQEVKDVVKSYDEYIHYRQIVYFDPKYKLVQLYFMPLLHSLTCLSEKTEYVSARRSAFSKVVLKRAPFRDKCLFQVRNKKQRLTIIRLDLVESILARNLTGFTLMEVEVEQ